MRLNRETKMAASLACVQVCKEHHAQLNNTSRLKVTTITLNKTASLISPSAYASTCNYPHLFRHGGLNNTLADKTVEKRNATEHLNEAPWLRLPQPVIGSRFALKLLLYMIGAYYHHSKKISGQPTQPIFTLSNAQENQQRLIY